MAISDAQFSKWAQSSTKAPVLLVEVAHKGGKVYLSDRMYATGAGETPEHVSYDVCLNQTVVVERALDDDSLGAIRVFNDGSLDDWLDYLFVGYSIEVYIGDKSWPRADFKRQFKGIVDSFLQLSVDSFEIKSTLAPAILQTELFNKNNLWMAGDHTDTEAVYMGNYYGNKRWRIAKPDQFDRDDVTITYYGSPAGITWVDDGDAVNTFNVTGHEGTAVSNVSFACPAVEQKFKSLFTTICTYIGQPINSDNLTNYPVDPDITFYITKSLTFPEFLELTLDTIGAVKWVNDDGEIEFYRKELPSTVDDDTVFSWITPHDEPNIKTVTTEDPVTAVLVRNSDFDTNSESTPSYTELNVLDLDYPNRALITRSYAKDSEAITEARRLADLLDVTRRTYSISLNRISPEMHIGAIVNIYSPKDRWDDNGVGLNALVVGFSQSFISNTSELIVWR